MKYKNILFLAHHFYPHVGGVEKHVSQISSLLLKKGYSISVITWQHDNSLPQNDMIDGVRVIRIPYNYHENKILTWSWIIQHFRLFVCADVIHVHDVFWWTMPLALFFRSKTFITFHGYEGSESPHFGQRLQHQLAHFLTQGSIGIGGFHKKWYGVSPSLITFGAIERKVKGKRKKVKGKIATVYIGRLSVDVGIMTYLKLVKILHDKKIPISLDVYGDGPLRKKAEQFVAKNKLDVQFKGFVPNASQFLPNYSIAFVSRHLAILEALALGIPVLAEYNNEIKKDYLQLSPFANWIKIGKSAEDFLPFFAEKLTVSKKANSWAREQTWERLVDQYEAVWERIYK